MQIGGVGISENPLSFPTNDAVDPDNRLTPEVTPESAVFGEVVYVEAEDSTIYVEAASLQTLYVIAPPQMLIVVAEGL